jgi:rhodanese-related sulfurtransferase
MAIKPAKELVAAANTGIETITVDEARRLFDDGKVQFVDIREKHEWDAGHVPGAVHVPRGSLEFLADPSIPTHVAELHSDKKLVLYCAAGGRSALATKTLKDMGFTDICHVQGGYSAWHQAGNPIKR